MTTDIRHSFIQPINKAVPASVLSWSSKYDIQRSDVESFVEYRLELKDALKALPDIISEYFAEMPTLRLELDTDEGEDMLFLTVDAHNMSISESMNIVRELFRNKDFKRYTRADGVINHLNISVV